ncbi:MULTISPECIES: ABC transporter substrate-binding protein [Cryobacterium]|jgi:alpha-glucoside transport system substrate-binding protein|uniref:ABC transporter substrate-binding protein n=2 Tax=Cryobacterium TaxID=69578 RepID=A0ABY7NID9_9MICO|nr:MULTISPECIES: ABC transporter substrate-binding protein [Cryobacterium]MDY7529282.1 ABC transporter substrate-binding protein [Cryobacterium sp. 10C2]MDY7541667.1 ABC transporter substrate-binding protein [Cryobacterium sp. 5B3]MDY7558560.1 ABC transporter substrate-binding protein [Cryobacterium sp. 10C3]MEA9999048.1 ABC transporter substrate-binding protein [Cryobacterium sp. RTS3]MEB0003308.1 ABC transporter substrate-binding protein [Cryobacterium sp. RTC2.1]
MSVKQHRRLYLPLATAAVVGLALTGCTGDIAASSSSSSNCADYASYGTFKDSPEVKIGGTIQDVEADRLVNSWADFQSCTGIKVTYQGTKEFEAQIAVLAEGGNAPDIGIIPQPGLFNKLAAAGFLKKAPAAVEANVDKWWSKDWKGYGTAADGTFYAAPLMASVKGYVWYSPAEFKAKGYEIPKTLDELTALTAKIAADGDHKPWCAGVGSGDATGWPGTDWVEDYVLRQAGADTYDKWVTHKIPFNDPAIVKAFDSVGAILKNPDDVNGGLGDVSSIISTQFGDAGLPILDGKCSLHHQASFYEGFWKKADGSAVTVSPTGDVYAFLLPPVKAGGDQAVTGGGELVGAFKTSDAITATLTYLSSDTWANNRVKEGGVISANTGLDPANASSDLLKQSITILQDPKTVFRFDGSDLMPGAVGTDSFWKGIVSWLSGDSSQKVTDTIEASWPKS